MKLLAATSLLLFLMMFESSHGSCRNGWQRILQTSEKSTETLNNLIQEITKGSKIRIELPVERVIFDVDWIKLKNNRRIVYAEAFMDIWDHKAHFLLNTNGYVKRQSISNFITERNMYDMIWFTKSLQKSNSNMPLYKHSSQGIPISGQVSHLISAVESGYEIFALMNNNLFPLHVLIPLARNSSVIAYNAWHFIENTHDNSPGLSQVFTVLSTSGKNYNLMKNSDSVVTTEKKWNKISWFADSCWVEIYSNNLNGRHIKGSKNKLISSIKKGHRVRVAVNSVYTEASKVYVLENSEVSAQLINKINVTISDTENDPSDVFWNWMMVSTTGRIQSTVGDTKDVFILDWQDQRRMIRWFVDTRPIERISIHRRYRRNLQTMDQLKLALHLGSSLRIGVVANTAPITYWAVKIAGVYSDNRKLEAKSVGTLDVTERAGNLVIPEMPNKEVRIFYSDQKMVTHVIDIGGERTESFRYPSQMDWFIQR